MIEIKSDGILLKTEDIAHNLNDLADNILHNMSIITTIILIYIQ